MENCTRLFDAIYYQNEKYPQEKTFVAKEKGEWTAYSSKEIIEQVNNVSLALLKLGVQPDDKIAIVSNNRPEWNCVDMGLLQVGAINVPIYATISEQEYKFIFNSAEIKYAFVSDKDLYAKISNIRSEIPTLKEIYTFDLVDNAKNYTVDFLALAKGGDLAEVEKRKAAITGDMLATIIYTSGTTGDPKGVMLSHSNILRNIKSCWEVIPVDETMHVLSFLPLCHIFERMVVYIYIIRGTTVYYSESMDTIAKDLREVKPNFFTTVPRLLEKVYMRLEAAGAELTGWKKGLYKNAIAFAKNYDNEKPMSLADKLKRLVYDRLIYSKWREALGGQCHGACSGSAALNPMLTRLFTCAGIPIIEGYGQTETSPVISVNPLDAICFETVGPPVADVQVQLRQQPGMENGEGEILVKGPNVMMGYYKRPDLTEAVFEDGWLKTGDVATWKEFRGRKYLKITDRVKELFKTSGGKYVSPQQIENKMKEIPYIEQIMVIGENRNFVAALVVPNFMSLSEWAAKHGVLAKSQEELVKNPDVIALFKGLINKKNEGFGHWETIKKFELMPKEWSINTGELTPSLKLKRKFINEKYKEAVEKIYSGATDAAIGNT